MAAYDNVSLPAPPDIAHAGNYAQMLMQGLSNLGESYQKGKNFQYQQQQRNLFQNGLPQDANGDPDISAISQKLIKSGGAEYAKELLPFILKQQYLQKDSEPQPNNGAINTSTPNQNADNLAKASQRLEGGGGPTYPRTDYTNPSDLSAGTDNDGRPPTIRQMATNKGLDPESPQIKQAFAGTGLDRELFSPSVIAAAQKRLTELKGGGVSPQSPPSATLDAASGGAPPINAASANQGNEPPAVGAGGGQAVSPAPTAAAGAIQPSGPQVAQATPAAGGAAGMVPPAWRNNPLGYADVLDKRAEAKRKRAEAMSAVGFPSKAAEDQAADWSAQAKAIREQLSKPGELTAQKRIEDDQKYYGSLHRGLAGSGMIVAQQKQNLHALMDVAPTSDTGFGSDVMITLNRMAAKFGINPTGAAPRELFNSLAARVLADQFSGIKSMASETGEQGARIFKPMLDIEEKANITPKDSLEGVKAKLNMMDKAGDLMIKWADKADDYKIKHGALDAGFDKELRADIAKARIENVLPKSGSAPAIGRVEQGYRFKGGDHRDKNNWVPVSSGKP